MALIDEGVELAENVTRSVFGSVDFLPTPSTPVRPSGPVEAPGRFTWTWAMAGTRRRSTVALRPPDVGPCALCGQLHRGHYGPAGGPLCDRCEEIRKGLT